LGFLRGDQRRTTYKIFDYAAFSAPGIWNGSS
jgi:hypothetical protein